MRILTAAQVTALLPVADCIDQLDLAMRSTSAGRNILPLRPTLDVPDSGGGKLVLMPGYLAEPASFGVKIVSKYPRAPDSRYGTHEGAVMLLDAAEGVPRALMHGGRLTAIRTAAASGLATRVLARADASRLAIFGAGEQARWHIAAMLAVRPIRRIVLWARQREQAEALLAGLELPDGVTARFEGDARAALDGADIACTVTSAKTPYLMGAWLPVGLHLNLVGAAIADAAEVDGEAVRRARFFTDYRPSAMAQAGELRDAIAAGIVEATHLLGELGEVLDGRLAGRTAADQITIYKSLGIAAQDLAAAHHVWQRALATGTGIEVDLAD